MTQADAQDPDTTSAEGQSESLRAKFDKAVATLINNGANLLKELVAGHIDVTAVPDDADFWLLVSEGTMFDEVDEETVYLLVLKIMQGREAWKDRTRVAELGELNAFRQTLLDNGMPYTTAHLSQFESEQTMMQTRYQGPTEKAVDDFTATIHTLENALPGIGRELAWKYTGSTMAGVVEKQYMANREAAAEEDGLLGMELSDDDDMDDELDDQDLDEEGDWIMD